MNITRRSALHMIGGASAAGLLPLGARRAQAASGTVVVAIEEAPKQLDPLRYLTNPGYRVIYNIFDTLIGVDYRTGGSKLVPGLAASWQRIDNKTVEVKLRQNVKFHDGSTMTAEDVVFSFGPERINTKGSPGYANAQQHLSTIDKAVAVSADTVRISSKEADPALELRLSAWGAQIVSKAAFEKAGWDGFAQKPIGTGPYMVEAMQPDQIRLKSFAGHWAGEPKIATLVFRGVPELSARIAGLTSGDFQLIADVPPDQFPAVTRSSNLEIVGGPIASMRVVKFDTRNPQLKDPRVRQAMAMSVDRDAIVKSLWAGQVDVPRGHQLEGYGAFYDASYPAYTYNPAKARELLAAAGYKGETIPYRTRVNAYGAEMATAQVLVAMWSQVGIKVDLQIKETFGQLLEFPGTGLRNGADPVLVNDPLFGIWRSYNEAEKDVWSNEEFYKLGHQLETEMDPARRKQAFQGMVKIFDQDPPAIILHRFGVFYAKVKNLNWSAYPHVYMDFRQENASI